MFDQKNKITHFTEVQVQQWARDYDVIWYFHVFHWLRAASMIQNYNGLLKIKLVYLISKFTRQVWVLAQAVQMLNEQTWYKGGSPMDVS